MSVECQTTPKGAPCNYTTSYKLWDTPPTVSISDPRYYVVSIKLPVVSEAPPADLLPKCTHTNSPTHTYTCVSACPTLTCLPPPPMCEQGGAGPVDSADHVILLLLRFLQGVNTDTTLHSFPQPPVVTGPCVCGQCPVCTPSSHPHTVTHTCTRTRRY